MSHNVQNSSSTLTAPVDVLAVMVKLCTFGGTFEPAQILPQFNTARSTSTLRSHLGSATSTQVRAALRKAERVGDVECVPHPSPSWRQSAADRAELHWQITPAALARVRGAA